MKYSVRLTCPVWMDAMLFERECVALGTGRICRKRGKGKGQNGTVKGKEDERES